MIAVHHRPEHTNARFGLSAREAVIASQGEPEVGRKAIHDAVAEVHVAERGPLARGSAHTVVPEVDFDVRRAD